MAGSDEHGLAGLGRATVALVSDALDQLLITDRVLDAAIRPLEAGMSLVGRAVPVVVEATQTVAEDPYASQMTVLDSLRHGDVPLFCVEPATRAALWGELFACAALGRQAAGAIVDGYIRDARGLRRLKHPVFSRGPSPLDTLGRAEVRDFAVSARCGGVAVGPGDIIIADDDGIIAIPREALGDVLTIVEEKAAHEHGARIDLLAGVSIFDVWDKWRVF